MGKRALSRIKKILKIVSKKREYQKFKKRNKSLKDLTIEDDTLLDGLDRKEREWIV